MEEHRPPLRAQTQNRGLGDDPEPLRLRVVEERASYALGVTTGMLAPEVHPLQVLGYYHNGTTGRPYRQAIGSPRAEVKVPAVASFYSGRAMSAMSKHVVPGHSKYDEWFRWGMDVGRSSFEDPARLYIFKSSLGQRYSAPRGATSLRSLGQVLPQNRQAYLLGQTAGVTFPSLDPQVLITAFRVGCISNDRDPPLEFFYLQGDTYIGSLMGFNLGRIQKKTCSDVEQEWFAWGVEVGRELDIRLIRDDRYVMPNLEDIFMDTGNMSPEDEFFDA